MTPLSPQPAHIGDEQLAAYLDERLTPSERATVVAHLADCDDCRHAMIAAHRLVGPRATHRPTTWGRTIPLLVAAVVAFAVVPSLFRSDATMPEPPSSGASPVQRGMQPDSRSTIEVVAPADRGIIPPDTLLFLWRSAGADATYRVVLQDSTGAPVWETTVADTVVVLPRTTRLERGQQYFWSVDAQLADGRPARGGVRRFTVK